MQLPPVLASSGIREVRLRDRAIRKGWIKAPNEDWPLQYRSADFTRLSQEQNGDLSLMEKTAYAVFRDLDDENPSVRQVAVRSAITMRAQNLSADHHEDRMDYYERTHEARGGLHDLSINVGQAVQIYIPHNFRDEIPGVGGPSSIPQEILDAQTIDETDPDFDD